MLIRVRASFSQSFSPSYLSWTHFRRVLSIFLDLNFLDFHQILLNEPYMAQEAPGLVFLAINVETKIPKSGLGLI